MKKHLIFFIISVLTCYLFFFSLTSCINTAAQNTDNIIQNTEEGSKSTINNTIDISHIPLQENYKAVIIERYGKFNHYGYKNLYEGSTLEQYSYPDDAFCEEHIRPNIINYSLSSSAFTQNSYMAYIGANQNKVTSAELLSQITLGMTSTQYELLLGRPNPWVIPYQDPQMSFQPSPIDLFAYAPISYTTTDGKTFSFIMDYAGTGTESDPFRTVISEIWCDGELIDACDTVAEQMALGILPTFLAVELHGTEYLISEGLLSEAEAVFYAEEQEIYLASQMEQESLPDAEIPETAPEAVVQ